VPVGTRSPPRFGIDDAELDDEDEDEDEDDLERAVSPDCAWASMARSRLRGRERSM